MVRAASKNETPIIIGLIAITLFSFVVFSVDTVGVVILVLLLVLLGVAIGHHARA